MIFSKDHSKHFVLRVFTSVAYSRRYKNNSRVLVHLKNKKKFKRLIYTDNNYVIDTDSIRYACQQSDIHNVVVSTVDDSSNIRNRYVIISDRFDLINCRCDTTRIFIQFDFNK